ncbi:class I SAM-dependent methyltransferase [Terasakiella sp. A23]|uniref:class I SAM-dependent methyltransferase n=1 Tax=Terasakiella sp. FCG-A23 TaxID=3080561 RepID=UPI002953A903|nr:class I SAM-dependent methyltransferase [Terasakiella sp. A23]MDV7339043.1 class I SAM-dependent methyltransferase [Terasakiella sp. A23]
MEIGVCEGNFSQEILAKNSPSELHLIDPWEYQERSDYKDDVNNVSNNKQEGRFRYVSKRFKQQTQTGQVKIHRDYSTNVASQYADKSLDWIFIDGLHSYEGVKADLQAYKDKIKEDGFILGHDYTNHPDAKRMNFGVIEAVNEFLEEGEFTLFAMTWENFPSYVLCRNVNSPNAQYFLGGFMNVYNSALELPDFPSKMTFKHRAARVKDRPVLIPTFSVKDA